MLLGDAIIAELAKAVQRRLFADHWQALAAAVELGDVCWVEYSRSKSEGRFRPALAIISLNLVETDLDMYIFMLSNSASALTLT